MHTSSHSSINEQRSALSSNRVTVGARQRAYFRAVDPSSYTSSSPYYWHQLVNWVNFREHKLGGSVLVSIGGSICVSVKE